MALLSKLKLPGACLHDVMDFLFNGPFRKATVIEWERKEKGRRERETEPSQSIAQLPLWEYTLPMYSRKLKLKPKSTICTPICRHIGTASELQCYTKFYATIMLQDKPEDLL